MKREGHVVEYGNLFIGGLGFSLCGVYRGLV